MKKIGQTVIDTFGEEYVIQTEMETYNRLKEDDYAMPEPERGDNWETSNKRSWVGVTAVGGLKIGMHRSIIKKSRGIATQGEINLEGLEPPKGWGELDFKKDYHNACNSEDDGGYEQESIVKEYKRRKTIKPERMEEIIHNYHTKHTDGYEKRDIVLNLNSLGYSTLLAIRLALWQNIDTEPGFNNSRALGILEDYLEEIEH